MPFTFSHPAAVLPFKRWGGFLPFSALVIGSLSPDIPYFLLTQTAFHHFGHTGIGVLVFDLPVGFLLFLVWHRLLKAPTVALLPQSSRERLQRVAQQPFLALHFSAVITVLLALLLGTLTHLAWDSFTHEQGWVVARIGALQRPLPVPLLRAVPAYNLLQYGSTLFGATLLGQEFSRWQRHLLPSPESATSLTPSRRRRILFALFVVAPVMGIVYTLAYHHTYGHGEPMKKIFADGIEAAITGAFLILSLFACVFPRTATQ